MERRRVRHRDLEVYAPAVRIFERCEAKASARTRRFFQHQVRIVEGEVGESLLFADIEDREAYEIDVEFQRSVQIAHIEFGNEARACQLARPLRKRNRADIPFRPVFLTFPSADRQRGPLLGRNGEGRLAVDEVEAVEVHDLRPRLGEVLDQLLLAIG
jgi:hypothetical protein